MISRPETIEAAAHERWMRLALKLARKGEGLTRPNPPVGAIIVKNGRLVSSGFHRRAGKDHAEIIALKNAGDKARNAALYVTLEPCSTFGRTPPCVPAIVRSGIRRVIVSVADPNPRHRGRGLALLRKAGVPAAAGVCRAEGEELIGPFRKWIRSGRPYVSLKMAMSFDGKTADCRGRSRWITGPRARAWVQALRRCCDAVMVGAGTILADNPCLLPKPSRGRRPWRIILDARGAVPPGARVFNDEAATRTVVATTALCPRARIAAWQKKGAGVWILPARGALVSIPALMKKMGRQGLLHVLCEGGAEVASSLVQAKAVDEFFFFIAPCLIGCKAAPSALGGKGWPIARPPRLSFIEWQAIGNDILIRAKPLRRRQKTVVRSQNI